MSTDFPYPGLRPFARDETDIFFGREEHTDQLLDRLDHRHFLAVVGPSGCGKSSLVRTGLLAGLETGFLSSAGSRWRIAELRPGNHPFANLTDALLVDDALGSEYLAHVTAYFTEPGETTAFLAAGSHRAMLQAQLRRGPFSLHELLEYAPLPANTKLLILVDQFEEIFRYYQHGAEDEAAAFVSLLLASSEHRDVYVVITMRSDFLGDCALFHGLPEAINQGLFLTPRLNREELRAAIEGPAAVFGGNIEPALVNRLLNDTGNNPDQLPVLQHALMRMWTIASAQPSPAEGNGKSEGVTLTLDHYVQIGGLDAALSQHADEAYNELDGAQQKIAEIMFRSLSERGSDRRDTRRPVPLREVAALAQVPWEQVAAVVEVFRQEGRSFLTPPVGRDLGPDSMLDVSHESLIRQWRRLQDWTTREAEAAELYQRLEDSARRWANGQGDLWRTLDLESALTWRDKVQPTPEWAQRYGQHFDLAMRFLDTSAARQRQEEQQAEAARQRELRQARRQVTLLSVGFAIAIGLVLWASWAQWQAYKSEERALLALAQTEEAKRAADAFAKEANAAREKAEESFQLARSVVDDFRTQLSDEKVKDVPGFQPVRKELVEVALKYYRGFIEQRGDDPSVQAELGRTYFSIGSITKDMGTDAEALKAFDEAAKIQQRLLTEHPDHADHLRDLGLTYYSMGEIHMFADRPHEALQSFEKARAFQEKLVSLRTDIDQYQYDFGNTFNRLGTTHTMLRNSKEAEYWFNRNLEILLRLADKSPKEPNYKLELSRSYNNLSILYKQEGKEAEEKSSLQKATEILEELLRDYPGNQHYQNLATIVYGNLANVQFRLDSQEIAKKSHQKSISIAKQLVQENPLIPKYREALIRLYFFAVYTLQQPDELDGAIKVTRELLTAKPDHADAWNSLGVFLLKQGRLEEAIAAYRKQLEITPAHEYAWINLGRALEQQGNLEEAIAAYQQQLKVKPDHADAWNNLGVALRAQGWLDDAIAAYRKQLEITPAHEYAWINLGRALEQQGQLDDAIAAYRKQLEVTPSHAWAWNNLGSALAQQGQLDDAIAAYRQQVAVTPDHAEAWDNLGIALQQQGQRKEAIAAHQQQLKVKPDHANAWNNLGVALRAQGWLDDAIAAYRKQLEITPAHEYAWINLGRALEQQGQLDDAIAAYRKQLEITPAHAWAWTNLGIALYRQGNLDEALSAFQQQVQTTPDHVDAWLMMGIVLWKQGKTDKAATAYAKGLAVQPQHLSLLSNDAELALAQRDIARLRMRIEAALQQVTPKDQEFAILQLLSWLGNPTRGWADVMTAITQLEPEVKFTWDFSDTRRAITHLDASTQQTAHHFIDFFEGHIDLPTLQASLAAKQPM